MSFSITTLFLHTGIASIAIALVILVLVSVQRSLALRHLTLKAGLIFSLFAPVPILIGTVFNLGMLPELDESSAAISKTLHKPKVHTVSAVDHIVPSQNVDSFALLESKPHEISSPLRRPETSSSAAPVISKPAPTTRIALPTVLAGVWLIGFAVCVFRYLWKLRLLQTVIDRCSLHDDEEFIGELESIAKVLRLRRVPQSLSCSAITSPVIAGLFSPKLLIPEEFGESSENETQRLVLTHELAHLKRRDHWTLLIQAATVSVFWWNPLTRMISRRLGVTREMLCDDIAIELNGRWQQYAQAMLTMAEHFVGRQRSSVSLAMATGDLELRLRRVLELEGKIPSTGLKPVVAFLIAAFSLVLFSGLAFAQLPGESVQKLPSKSESTPSVEENSSTVEIVPSAESVSANQSKDIPEFVSGNIPKRKYQLGLVDPDGNPVPNARVEYFADGRKPPGLFHSDAEGNAEFVIGDTLFQTASVLRVTSADGKFGALFSMSKVVGEKPERFEVELRPLVKRSVRVTNEANEAIAGATVAIKYGRLLYTYRDMGITNEDGVFAFDSPEGELVNMAMAIADGYGIDYIAFGKSRERRNQPGPAPDPFRANETQTIILQPPAPFETFVVDQQGKPLEDVSVHPWLVEKDDFAQLNLSHFHDILSRKTDASGRTKFDWFPRWQKVPVTVWASKRNYDHPRGRWVPGESETKIQLTRMTKISGVLLDQNGSPVVGCQVRCDGRQHHEQWDRSFTDDQGKFSFLALGGGELIICVDEDGADFTTKRRVSDFVRLTVPAPDQPLKDIVLNLIDPTPVTMRIVNMTSGKIVAGQRTTMSRRAMTGEQYRKNCELDPGWRMDSNGRGWDGPWKTVPSMNYAPSIRKHDGELKGWLAPGIYHLHPNDNDDSMQFIVEGEPATIEAPTDTGAISTLKGLVRIAGKPIQGAEVVMTSAKFRGDRWTATSKADGSYEIQMRENKSQLFCFSADRQYAAGIEADMFGERFDLNLKRVCEIKGTLVDRNNKAVANSRVYFGNKLYAPEYGGFVMTDSLGHFEIKGVCPGFELVIGIDNGSNGTRKSCVKLPKLQPGEQRDVGAIQ